MTKLDELRMERSELVGQVDMLRRSLVDIKTKLKQTHKHHVYTRFLEQRTEHVETLKEIDNKLRELKKQIRKERDKEMTECAEVAVDDTVRLLRIAADIIGQIDCDDLSAPEAAFLHVLRARVALDVERSLSKAVTTNIGRVMEAKS